MLRHQNSPVSMTVKAETHNFGESEYENLSMLRHQTSPVSLTRKSLPSGDSVSYNDNDYESSLSMLRQTQSSPMSLTTKSSKSSYEDHDDQDDQPVQLTVKMEPSQFINDDYEDVPTDLSMDTTDRHMKDKDDD